MSAAKFEAAKELIESRHYSEALAILRTIDHPTARKWERKIREIAPPSYPPAPQTNSWRRVGYITVLMIAIVFFVMWILILRAQNGF